MRFILRNKYLKGDKEFLERKYERIRENTFFRFRRREFSRLSAGMTVSLMRVFGWPLDLKVKLNFVENLRKFQTKTYFLRNPKTI